MNYVIIGNSAAAIGCVEGIRTIDKTSNITIISNEKYHTYSRPLISYLIYGKTDEERMKYRSNSFYDDNNCTVMLGKSVEKIDADAKKVIIEDGTEVSYDKLLVATGSRPFVPPMAGMENIEKKFTFMSLDDAKGLEAAITPESNVMIIGAGLIGLKCAEGISNRVKSITVVDLADRVLPSILDKEAADIVQNHIETKGINFILSDSVDKFEKNSATLKSGKVVDFDIAVLAVGVRPNTNLISDIGGEVNRGIIIDDTCATTIADIYSAGDCTEGMDISINAKRILALLPNAYMQGECAGINMAGGSYEFNKAIPMNAIGFFGLHMLTAGVYDGDIYLDKSENSYKKLVTADNTLKGFIMIGDIARAGIYTSMVREKTPLDTVDFELIKDKPQLMAFSRTKRDEILGGAK